MHETPHRSRLPGRRTVWRWHFYAGVLCAPVVIVLAASGSVYLFKSELESWIDAGLDARAVSDLPPRPPSAQVAAALAAVPGGTLKAYELPQGAGATRVVVSAPDGDERISVHPGTLEILGRVAERDRLMRRVFRLHGELWLGEYGSFVVELVASWTVVLILTGLWLWWPRSVRGGGVLWPRLGAGRRTAWRDLHAVTGFWVSGLALFLLLTGLPWTTVWNDAFKEVRRVTGTLAASQEWSSGRKSERSDPHAAHNAPADQKIRAANPSLDRMAEAAAGLGLPPPVLIAPPSPGGGWRSSPDWTVRSETPNRPQRVVLTLDPASGAVTGREDFGDKHPIDQAIGYGIAAHEGQLFGLANQLLGLFAASGLVLLSVSGIIMWRRRGPLGVLGAPERLANRNAARAVGVAILALGVFMPVLGVSLVVVGLVEFLVLRRLPRARTWLGLDPVR